MGLFGEEDEETAEEVDPPVLDDEPAVDPSEEDAPEPSAEADDEGDPGEEDLRQDDASEPEDPSEGPNQQGDEIDVEEALKDLSARMSVLSSNLEGVEESRGELEDKIGDVEERMSRLGSLAEAVSSEYNPFVSENAPSEPSWKPQPDDAGEPGAEPDAEEGPPLANDEPEAPPAGDIPEQTPPEAPEPQPDVGEEEEGPFPPTDPRSLEPEPEEPDQGQAPAAADPTSDRQTSRQQRDEPDEFEENLLLLEWVGMMLDRVGRAGLLDLLDYYQNLGWLDPEIKDQATRVAVGVDAPDRVGDENWRGDVELHRRSLVAIQRLQGDAVPAARVDELELDLRRLFRE
jgi:archaellum component FlaD/FlaE